MTGKNKPNRELEIDDLRVLAGGNFFKVKTPLSKTTIDQFFRDIAKKSKVSKPVLKAVQEARSCGAGKYNYSFLCFRLPCSPPPFFPSSKKMKELKYGFILIIQFGDTVAIFKRGPLTFEEWISDNCDSIPPRALLRVFGKDANYQKVSLRRMTISRNELRSCSYEAEDLSTTIPTLGLGRSVPRYVRLSHKKAGAVSITPSTSRVQKSGGRLTIDELAEVVSSISDEFSSKCSTPFLDAFPTAEEKLPGGVNPSGILFELPSQTDDESAWQVLVEKKGSKEDITENVRKRFASVLPVKKGTIGLTFGSKDLAKGTFAFAQKFSLELKDVELWIVKNIDGDEESFAAWIRRTKPFSICFDRPEWFYTQGQLYRRADFSKDIDLVRSALFPDKALLNALTEKGENKIQKYDEKSTAFRADSIFGTVEKVLYKDDQHLFCSDLNDEWADYMAINGPKHGSVIRFIHCKDADITSGASAFHEVTGQALKNLGRLQITPNSFCEKLAALLKQNYWKTKVPIPRYRGPGNVDKDIAALIASSDTKKEVILAVTFVSKERFEEEAKQTTLEPHFIQMIWIVSAFLHSCREMGAVGKIICKP